jgi:hypothetical protein
MGRVDRVMTSCETATWTRRSSVTHLVPLHSSYSHRTLREGIALRPAASSISPSDKDAARDLDSINLSRVLRDQ